MQMCKTMKKKKSILGWECSPVGRVVYLAYMKSWVQSQALRETLVW